MPDTLTVSTEQQFGLVSLLSFQGWNTISNITDAKKNNVLKITTTWYDRSRSTDPSISRQSFTWTITLEDGYYTMPALVAALNAYTDGYPTDGYVYRFGVAASTLTPGFLIATEYSKFASVQYPAILASATAFANNTHVYESFELTVDSSTIGLLKVLGYQLDCVQPISRLVTKIICNGKPSNTNGTEYVLTDTIDGATNVVDGVDYMIAPNYYNVNTTDMLYISLENSLSQNRATFTSLGRTDFMARIPVNAAFGSQIIWQATIDYPSYQANLNLSELYITICDEYGVNVDFNGSPWGMDIKIDWAYNADIPDGNANELTMHLLPSSTFDANRVAANLGSQYDRLFPRKPIGLGPESEGKKRRFAQRN